MQPWRRCKPFGRTDVLKHGLPRSSHSQSRWSSKARHAKLGRMGNIGLGAAVRLGLLVALTASNACNGNGDEGDDESTLTDEEQRCESAQIELTRSCFFPNGGDVNDDVERPSITNIAAAAEALEGGFYLPKIDASDATEHVGYVLEENETCRVSCLTQCDITLHSLCVSSLATVGEGEAPAGCLFCGEATREQCQSFIDACDR